MSDFQALCEYVLANDEEERKALLKEISDERLRQLLQTTEIQPEFVLKEEVVKQVLTGAQHVLCMRDALNVIKMNGNSLVYPLTEGETGYAQEVAEGAEIPVAANSSITRVVFQPKKVADRPMITRELIEDGQFDIIRLELEKAGMRMENKLNRDAIEMLLTNASNSVTWDSTNPLSSLASAITEIKKDGFIPDTLILTPEAEGDLLKSETLLKVAYAGNDEALRGGNIGTKLMGLKVYTLTATDSNGSWTGSVKAVVFAKNHAGAIAIREDLTTEEYRDPIRDLEGAIIKMRYDVKPFFGGAICLLTA